MHETLTIERMGQGPEGVAHLSSGKAVFVAGVAPGDVVEAQIVEEKSSFARAKLLRVIEPSSSRVQPRWAEAVAASVAPWQQVSYDAQLLAKQANVLAALTRIGGIDAQFASDLVRPVIGSKRQWGYRNKLEFGVGRNAAGKLTLGFRDEGQVAVQKSECCSLAVKPIEHAAKALSGALRYLEGAGSLGLFRVGVRASLRSGETEIALWSEPSGFPRAEVAKTLSSAIKNTSLVRVLATAGKARKVKKVEVLAGKGYWSEHLSSAVFKASAPSFFQVNTAQAEKLVSFALSELGGALSDGCPCGLEGLNVADLYAGGGTFSIPLALAGANVCAVEAEGSSVRDLRRNAEDNGVYVDVIGGDAARELAHLGHLDALVVDPPRTGLARGVVKDIAFAKPQKVIYISCNPSTWARDVKIFAAEGYKLTSVQPVDLFPQTYHVEVASAFERA